MTTSLAATGTVSSFSPAAGAFGAAGGSGDITVTAPAAWTAHTSDSWITITSPTSFSTDGTVSYTVLNNITGFDRTGAIEIGTETFLVRQAATDLADNLDPTSWSQQAVNAIYAAGITVGCGNNSFCKDAPVTREQMAAFLVRAVVGEDFSYTPQPYFDDVPATGWSFKYVQKLKDLGLTASSGTYNAAGTVTREQMAAFLVRAKFGEDFSYPPTPYFSDVPEAGWSFKYVQKLKEQGYTAVTGSYAAAEPVTREQMAAFLSRVFLGMTATHTVTSNTGNSLAGSYQGTAFMQGDAGSTTIATFTYQIDANGNITGMCTDGSDNNRQYAFGGTANLETGTIMFSFTVTHGNRVTFTGTAQSGTWERTATPDHPAAAGTFTATKTVTAVRFFTPEMIAGKSFSYSATYDGADHPTVGTFTINSDGTFVVSSPSFDTFSGTWSIDGAGRLVTHATDGRVAALDETDVFTITSTAGSSFTTNDLWTMPDGEQGTNTVTFTP